MNRPTWDEYFGNIAILASSRSTCIRRKVGAVIVRENTLLSTGYNGVPHGINHCVAESCIRNVKSIPSGTQLDICLGLHAEQNAIIHAAKNGINIKDSVIYCTTFPCLTCAKMIINCGIKEVIFINDYEDDNSKKMLALAGVKIRKLVI